LANCLAVNNGFGFGAAFLAFLLFFTVSFDFLAPLPAFLPPALATTTGLPASLYGGRRDGFVAPPTKTFTGVFFPKGFAFGFVESS
jgi:hypothetical protein